MAGDGKACGLRIKPPRCVSHEELLGLMHNGFDSQTMN